MTIRNLETSFTNGTFRQAVLFAISGVLGFGVDALTLYTIMTLGNSFYIGRTLSFISAASFTWWFNRRYTFSASSSNAPSWNEWLRFLIAMSIGGMVNYFSSIWSYQSFELVRDLPILALALGAIAGMAINFFSARAVLYKIPKRFR